MRTKIIKYDEESLKDLFCGCGKKAEVVWFLPAAPQKVLIKMSKGYSSNEPRIEIKQQPYGWSCKPHIPEQMLKEDIYF